MKEITLKAEIGNIPQVIAFIEEQLEKVACPLRAQMQIDVAVDELFSNIARYAYPGGQGEATVRFVFDEADRVCSVIFMDRGIPFDPLAQQAPDVTSPLADRPIGGLGIFLVRKTMDAVTYRYENGQNILTIQKKI